MWSVVLRAAYARASVRRLPLKCRALASEYWKERYPVKFEINMLRCIFCGFCEEVCPEEAIVMSKDYELTFTRPQYAILQKGQASRSRLINSKTGLIRFETESVKENMIVQAVEVGKLISDIGNG